MSQTKIQLTQRDLLDALQERWGQYISAFKRLNPAEQADFLKRQGYERFQDLLAHICAWWEEALKVVISILDNAELPEREYDIDAFNAEAVFMYNDWTEDDLIAHFENLREVLLDLVADLPDETLSYSRIAGWFYACVIEHAEEHRVS